MPTPLRGVRVIEVASWVMAPATGAILADWGAEVIKVEHPIHGDPGRGLVTGPAPRDPSAVNYSFHHGNRGKQSIGLDISRPEGRDILYRLTEGADVFLTNFLPDTRRRLQIDVEHIRACRADIIYAKASGLGPRGPDRNRGGFDYASFWGRGGIAEIYHTSNLEYPLPQNGGFGDLMTGVALAGGVAAALSERASHGTTSVVDASLFGMSAWILAREIAAVAGGDTPTPIPKVDRRVATNPLANIYRTRDGRFLILVGMQSDRHWVELCKLVDQPGLADDPRFVDHAARAANREECIRLLDEAFDKRPLAEWKVRLANAGIVWEPVQDLAEVTEDPQMIANDYLVDIPDGGGAAPRRLVAAPVQFDEQTATPSRTPEHGEQTELLLLHLGLDWDEIAALKERQVIP